MSKIMREFSKWAGEEIESVCQRNDTPRPDKELKPPWETQPPGELFKKICEESSEMVEAYYNYLECPAEKYRTKLAWELADLACAAMMLSANLDPILSGLRRGRVMKRDFPEIIKKRKFVMKKFIGVKIVEAEPMNLGDYNISRGWTIPENEDPKRPGSRVHYEDGYVSWCPEEVFKAYRPCDAMTFGLAIEAMKLGHKVARAGWNGKGIHIFLVDEAVGFKRVGFSGENCDIRLQQHIAIDTTGLQTTNDAAPKSMVPWLASQTDMLADDWEIVE